MPYTAFSTQRRFWEVKLLHKLYFPGHDSGHFHHHTSLCTGENRKNKEKQYRRYYLSEFNNIFLRLIEPSYLYDDKKGISEKSYKMIQLSSYDRYEANGLISGTLEDCYPFQAGQVTTRSTYEDQNENRITRIDFDGILYEIKLPINIYSKLYLRSDKKADNAGFF